VIFYSLENTCMQPARKLDKKLLERRQAPSSHLILWIFISLSTVKPVFMTDLTVLPCL
jgi:hypothetical protein